MILVDIGNTFFHVYKNGKMEKTKKIEKFIDKVYYISVNEDKEKELLNFNPNAVNLKNYVKFNTLYSNSLGIDRIMACKMVEDGVVVDAGTFITIDVMEKGLHKGGVIVPGLKKILNIYKQYPALDVEIKYPIKDIPKNTPEAIGEGSIGMIVEIIKKYSKGKKIYFTGGDGEFFAKILNGIYIEDLVFKGMIKTIKEDL